jgi:hypothetical protein
MYRILICSYLILACFAYTKKMYIEEDNLVVFDYFSAYGIWPHKRDSLWWECPHKRDSLWWEWPHKRDGLWWEWPHKRNSLWWECLHKRESLVGVASQEG